MKKENLTILFSSQNQERKHSRAFIISSQKKSEKITDHTFMLECVYAVTLNCKSDLLRTVISKK